METHAEYHAQNPLPICGVIFARMADVIEPPKVGAGRVIKHLTDAQDPPQAGILEKKKKEVILPLEATKKVRAANLKKRIAQFKAMAKKKDWMRCEDIALIVRSTPDCTRQKLERLVESGNVERKTESRKHVLYRWVSSSTNLKKD